MMAAVREWLLSLVAAALLCALADALMPKGAVRRVGRLVCGLVLLAAILSPAVRLDVAGGQRWLEDYLASVDRRTAELRETVDSQRKVIIEQEYAAYIVDKAAELGLSCSVRVTCRDGEEGLYLPERVEITGTFSDSARAGLARCIAEELGVPETEQRYIDKEEVP